MDGSSGVHTSIDRGLRRERLQFRLLAIFFVNLEYGGIVLYFPEHVMPGLQRLLSDDHRIFEIYRDLLS